MPQSVGPLPTNARHQLSNIVQEHAALGTATNKINFVVPNGFNLFVEHFNVCIVEGDGIVIELQDDGTGLSCVGNGEAKEGGGSVLFPPFNPIGPIAAGSTVRLSRISGTSGKDWTGTIIGYLEAE